MCGDHLHPSFQELIWLEWELLLKASDIATSGRSFLMLSWEPEAAFLTSGLRVPPQKHLKSDSSGTPHPLCIPNSGQQAQQGAHTV